MTDRLVHLRADGTSLVLDLAGDRLPRVLHWGADLGPVTGRDLADLPLVLEAQRPTNALDVAVPVSLVPEASAGWLGSPGLTAHRSGRHFSTSFAVRDHRVETDDDGTQALSVESTADEAALDLDLRLEMRPGGLVRLRATVRNRADETLDLGGVLLALPVPADARELLDLTGRHLKERVPQRHPFTYGTHLRENRRGRTGTDASVLMVAGEPGFGFRRGRVWGVHVAWSGNHRELAEATTDGVRLLGGGELLLPGEVRLAEGESYTTPWLCAAYADGLDALASRFHRFLRDRPGHPRTARPVTLNTWEAVYFEHGYDRLSSLAELGARVGAERFVLDDGWFRGRRHDRAGLGDWYVDPAVWPGGLQPLVDRVHGLGMQFGLWVEPEMVNPDSDLAREHPDWVMRAREEPPPLSRSQQVLDVARPDAFAYLLERLDALVGEHGIDYLKWDHNRDLVDAGHGAGAGAAVHEQTLAVYRLMDELRRRHPGLEIESCSSGGGRVDLGVLERTDRVWTSDCIDPLERQQIQRWTGLLLPPELLGSHVGAPTSHTTGRAQVLDFRAGTALFGHFGIEWDLTGATEAELDRLSAWVAAHKALRPLLHGGTVVTGDHPDPAVWVHGVVSQDRTHGLFAVVQTATGTQSPPGPVRLPGLDPERRYRVAPRPPGDRVAGLSTSALRWWDSEPVLPGSVLGERGVQAPLQFPERLVLVEVTAAG